MFYLLEAAGFETWLVNAKDVKHLPGRPKTDKLDAVWLAKVAERQMCGCPPDRCQLTLSPGRGQRAVHVGARMSVPGASEVQVRGMVGS